MIKERYEINGKVYDLKPAVDLIRIGKWDSGIKKIESICNVKGEESRKIGKMIKQSIAEVSERINENFDTLKSRMVVTSGFNFDGYTITNYITPIAAESNIGTGGIADVASTLSDMSGSESVAFSEKIEVARSRAYESFLKKAVSCGANAVIGFKYDYVFTKSNAICVFAQGTAVNIENK